MNSQELVLQEIQKTVQDSLAGKITILDCSVYPLYKEAGMKGMACYGSTKEPAWLAQQLENSLNAKAYTDGWREDYGVYGAFYQLKDGTLPAFGIDVGAVKGNREFDGSVAIKPYQSFITITVNDPK
ncbi:hypothetical protein EHF33_04925 [Deinococcus psychrotolerans]|uniref:Uncharacterized protein n=1 Tax=Deinococcus psychrotolerans TaxID=2489213 RepID=A0A3G8YB62_9DEIO|nr:hypothetical protein [Deinococcus psychrotolerans]AZI42170.1 hypothetical protein EHF33_04925 [Deinococcus psychrotolerans]